MDFDPDYWVLGSSSYYDFPYPDFGAYDTSTLEISSTDLDPHRSASIAENEMRFMLAVFGDNEQGDCYHSGFYFSIEVDIGQY